MSGRRAKALRREGIPEGPGTNVTDLIDTREQRRDKRFRKKKMAAEMKATDPIRNRKLQAFWLGVRLWLTMPDYRDGLEDPHRGKRTKGE